jgi:hypothetical protein
LGQHGSTRATPVPKDGIGFLTTCLDRGIRIAKKDETEKHLKPRDTPVIFTRVIFGNIRGPMTSGKPSHHCRSKIGALQNALESLLVDRRVIKTGISGGENSFKRSRASCPIARDGMSEGS